MSTPIIYVAHKFGGDTGNLDLAEKWCADLSFVFDGMFIAPWVPLCSHWPDNGDSRKRGLSLDRTTIHRCNGVIFVGPEVSAGMAEETQYISASRIFSAAVRLASVDSFDAWTSTRLREWLLQVSNLTIDEHLKVERGAK